MAVNTKMIGMGYFGKPETFSRVLDKIFSDNHVSIDGNQPMHAFKEPLSNHPYANVYPLWPLSSILSTKINQLKGFMVIFDGQSGCISFMFKHMGKITYKLNRACQSI